MEKSCRKLWESALEVAKWPFWYAPYNGNTEIGKGITWQSE
jgi:hypothetical protein